MVEILSLEKNLNLKTYFHDYGQTAIVGSLKHDNNHNNIAVERFLTSGPYAMLPLSGGKETSIVWTERTKDAENFLKLDKEEIEKEISKLSQGYLENPKVIGKLQYFPLNMVYSSQNIYHRVILLGDSAHGMHPLAGQGFNVAVRDIKSLDKIISYLRFSGQNDVGCEDVVREFYQNRKFDIFSLISATHAINAIFSNNLPILRKARKYGILAADKLPFIKNVMLKKAAGLE